MYKSMKKHISLFLAVFMIMGIILPSVSFADNKVAKKIDIVTQNDFHGAVEEVEGRTPGMAKIVGKAREMKKENPNTIFVSGGDSYQGTAISNLKMGDPVVDMMKLMGVELSAVGNHEFDWGRDKIAGWAEKGNLTFLAANIIDEKTGQRVTWAEPYKIIERDGVKIGFIGLAHPDTSTLTKKEHVEGVRFEDPVKAAEVWVEYLKAGKDKAGKPDVIIALTHIDSDQDEDGKITGNVADVSKVKGIDAIVSGHSHRRVAGDINGVPVVQGGSNGYNFGVLSIELDNNNKVIDIKTRLEDLRGNISNLPVDKEADRVLKKYQKEVQPILGEVIGKADGRFEHNSKVDNVTLLGRWSSEVMRDKANVQIAIQNGGGLRRSLESGDITIGDMYEIMPFDNTLVKLELLGKDIKAAIDLGIDNPNVGNGQFVGLEVEYNKNAEFKNRITKITLEDGTPLEDDKYYSVVTNDFLITGGDKYDFSNARNVVNTYIPIREVLVEAIKEAKVIKPKEIDYLVAIDGDAAGPKFNKEDHNAYINGYEDNTVKPEGNITREEAAAVIYRLLDEDYKARITSKEGKFTDLKTDRWSSEAILSLTNGKVLNGYEDNTFKPHKEMTRAELMAIVAKFADKGEVKSSGLKDIKGHWAEDFINLGVQEGWIQGYEDNTFKPGNNITRAEFVTVMNNVLGRKVTKENMLEGRVEYKDLKSDKWYYDGMQEAINSHKYNKDDKGIEKWSELIKKVS